MRFICKARCMFRGDIWKPGAVLDIDPAGVAAPDADVFRSSFEADKTAPSAAVASKLSNGLTRDQAASKLQASGFAVPDGLTDEALANLCAKAFGGHIAPDVKPAVPAVPAGESPQGAPQAPQGEAAVPAVPAGEPPQNEPPKRKKRSE